MNSIICLKVVVITKPTMQLTAFYNGNFKDEIHQVSVGLTIFL